MPKPRISLCGTAVAAIAATSLCLSLLSVAQADQPNAGTPAAKVQVKKHKQSRVVRKESDALRTQTYPDAPGPIRTWRRHAGPRFRRATRITTGRDLALLLSNLYLRHLCLGLARGGAVLLGD
jgi:hypothetical protein